MWLSPPSDSALSEGKGLSCAYIQPLMKTIVVASQVGPATLQEQIRSEISVASHSAVNFSLTLTFGVRVVRRHVPVRIAWRTLAPFMCCVVRSTGLPSFPVTTWDDVQGCHAICLAWHTSLPPTAIVQTQPHVPAHLQGMLGNVEAHVGL